MGDPLDHTGSANQRMDRVETQVSSLSGTVTAQGTTLQTLSESMIRMEGAVVALAGSVNSVVDTMKARDHDAAEVQRASKPNVVAIVAVLITILSAMIGGAWVIGGTTARLDERDIQRDKQITQMQREVDRLERRQWERK